MLINGTTLIETVREETERKLRKFVNLRTRVEPWEHVELWARIDNLFDSDYETGGARNLNAFADPIAEERFLAPGAPRAGWIGVKLRF